MWKVRVQISPSNLQEGSPALILTTMDEQGRPVTRPVWADRVDLPAGVLIQRNGPAWVEGPVLGVEGFVKGVRMFHGAGEKVIEFS